MSQYRHPGMRQFAEQQARFPSAEQKRLQLAKAEGLLAELDAAKSYPYQYVCYRITDHRSEQFPDLVLSGADLRHDLLRLLDDLAEAAPIEPGMCPEPLFTVEDLSRRYSISGKTVNRWRARGLVSRRAWIDGRKRVAFLQSSVERFVNAHAAEVERGARFSQLTERERDELLAMAREYAQAPAATLVEVSRRVGKQMGRSTETVRYTIKNHDQAFPERAIFPDARGPLDEQSKQTIHKALRRGVSVDALAKRFGRTRSSIHRVANELRAKHLLAQPIEYMKHDSFDLPTADRTILEASEPEAPKRGSTPKPPSGLPPYLQSLYEVPLLTREQEQHLFRRMNYLLHKAAALRAQVDPARAKASDLDRIEGWLDAAGEVKRRLIRANLRLVVSIAKRHIAGAMNLFELISDGNVSLMRAVEKFDFGRGFKFSTYASWAIMKNFARTIPAENQRRDRFMTGQELAFELTPDVRANAVEREWAQARMQTAVESMLGRLEEREREILMDRYGLCDRKESQTLEQVGSKFGVTKERIRQIEARAIRKLKRIAQEEKLDFSLG